jgi:hypothetical protein
VGQQNVKLVADDSWTEGGITYNSRPALGTSIGTFGPTTINTSYSVPLTVGGLSGELGQQRPAGARRCERHKPVLALLRPQRGW